MRGLALAASLAVVLVPAIASAFPASTEPHHGCNTRQVSTTPPTGGSPVLGELSYLDFFTGSLGCTTAFPGGGIPAEFGSSADPCGLADAGPKAGVFCGPLLPAGAPFVCSIQPVTGASTALTVGFDVTGDGYVTPADGDLLVVQFRTLGTTFTLANPTGSLAKVLAFPTVMDPALVSAGAINLVHCA